MPPTATVKLGSGHLNSSPHTVQYTDTSPCQIQLASLCHENRSYLPCHHPSSALLLALATRGEQEANIRWSVKLSPVKLMKYTHFTSQYKIFLLFNVLSISPWRVTINLPHINLYHQANETSYYYQPGRTDHYSFSCADEMMPRILPSSISPGHCRASICVKQTPQYCLISFIYPHINSSLMLVITSNFVLQNLE